MSSLLPIRIQELCSLQRHEVTPEDMMFGNCSIESDKYIVMRTGAPNGPWKVVLVDLETKNKILDKPINADSIIINPAKPLLAIRAGPQMQIFDFEQRHKVKAHLAEEKIVYWRWISPDVIGYVTETSVWHWHLQANEAPEKIFERLPSLIGIQITGYKADDDMKFFLVHGITMGATGIMGQMQLYSTEKKKSQPIEGHAPCFVNYQLEGNTLPSSLVCFVQSLTTGGRKLSIFEIAPPTQGNTPYPKKSAEVHLTEAGDFPVSIQATQFGVVYLFTKHGFLHVFDVESAATICVTRVSNGNVFLTTESPAKKGVICVNKLAQILFVGLDESTAVHFIGRQLQNPDLALRLAIRGDLPGAEEAFLKKFQHLFGSGNYEEAAKVVMTAPRGILRTPQTLQLFQNAPMPPSGLSALGTYSKVVLEHGGQLNKFESLELCRNALLNDRLNLVERWIGEKRLEFSEELGDLVRPYSPSLALSIYLHGHAPHKVVQCFTDQGEFDKMIVFAQKTGFQPDYLFQLRQVLRTDPVKGLKFAQLLVAEGHSQPLVDINQIVDCFVEVNAVEQCTKFLIETLKGDRPAEGHLQTRLLEMNLQYNPQVADAILGSKMFSHYDRAVIGRRCEQAQLLQRALEHFTDLYDIKRVVVHTQLLNIDWLIEYFGQLGVAESLECLKAMLQHSVAHNTQAVVLIAAKYNEQLTTKALIEMFESFKSSEGLFTFLGQLVNFSQDPEVHYKYIQAAARTGQIREVERVCRESVYYDPDRVKNFLKDAQLVDQLMIVCDRHNMVHDLVLHLYRSGQERQIQVFVSMVNPARLPVVVGALLDADCGEEFIKALITGHRGRFSIDELVEEVDKRNRLKLLGNWLETRVRDGATDAATHNALAKIYIDLNNQPERFLRENQYYDPQVVGRYCEKRNPHCALVAYERAGSHDDIIKVCNENSLSKHLARYLVQWQNLHLWSDVLSEANPHRRQLIDQVIQTALPESENSDEISITVKAFMDGGLAMELIGLLEKIVLDPNSMFSTNTNLQNLLILTAVNKDSSRVMEYVQKLEHYDAPDIANVAMSRGLYEEAFTIFRKFNVNTSAIQVLIENMSDVARAYDFAERVNQQPVWATLAKAQLQRGLVREAVDSFIKAGDPTESREVVRKCTDAGYWEELVTYLEMACKRIREAFVETELCFAYAKTGRLSVLRDNAIEPGNARLEEVGDRCFAQSLFEAAKILYDGISHYAKLARTLVKLGELERAADVARKANNVETWKQVCFACVDQQKFNLAKTCGRHIVIHADELEELVNYYQHNGYFKELIALLHESLALDRAHMGMFTELAILYCKHKPEKLHDELDKYWSRINTAKVVRAAEEEHLWSELAFLHDKCGEYDDAVRVMIDHPTEAWREQQFKELIAKVANVDLYYKAIQMYLAYKPLLLNELLTVISARLDHSRTVSILSQSGQLALARSYLQQVQHVNIKALNECLNALYVEEEDYEALRASVDTCDNFDHITLAQTLENHPLVAFRRIAAYLYKGNNRWKHAVELCLKDELWNDAIDFAAESRQAEVVEDLLRCFLEKGLKECFAATLYKCFDLVKPDLVMELAWKHKIVDLAMPYLIQVLRDFSLLAEQFKKSEAERKEEAKARLQRDVSMLDRNGNMMLTYGSPAPALMPPPRGTPAMTTDVRGSPARAAFSKPPVASLGDFGSPLPHP